FSSRRRHTRLVSDWSSDVCSSDLGAWRRGGGRFRCRAHRRCPPSSVLAGLHECSITRRIPHAKRRENVTNGTLLRAPSPDRSDRSEERRVGKEGVERWGVEQYTSK